MDIEKQIKLVDGRYLGYAEYGISDGFPVLFFHGLPGSRFEAQKLHQAAMDSNIRLIGLDRPGMGLSSPQKNRTVVDWANDINEFTNHLNIEKLSVMGHSGGAPYVVACAHQLPQKIYKAVIISGIAPLTIKDAVTSLSKQQRQMFWMIRYCPFLLNIMMRLSQKSFQKPERLKNMIKQLPDADKVIFNNTHYRDEILMSLQEAFRQSIKAVVNDFKLLPKPLEIELHDIKCPVVIWQGRKDRQAPVKHAQIYAETIPDATLKLLDNEGHISILYNYGKDILESAL